MTLQEIYEENKERLLSAVGGGEPAAAVPALCAELDRILYAFNDREEDPRVREAAGGMMQAAKAACALADCAGEAAIYGRTEYSREAPAGGRMPKGALLLLILGLIGAAVTVAGAQLIAANAAAGAADWRTAGLPPRWLLALVPLLTAALLFLAGMLLRRGKTAPKETLHAEVKLDAARVCNRLLSVMLVMDKRLEEVRSASAQEERARRREQASAMDGAELALLSQLLEDAYGRKAEEGRGEEEISLIRFYLHRKGIEVVDWTGEDAGGEGSRQSGWFDMIPAYSGGTLRPALAADGTLLKKGLASAGRG